MSSVAGLNGTGGGDAGWAAFQNNRLSREVIEPAIEDLKTTQFEKFRSNYLCIVTFLPNNRHVVVPRGTLLQDAVRLGVRPVRRRPS